MTGHDAERRSSTAGLKRTAQDTFDLLCRHDELTIPEMARRLDLETDTVAGHVKTLLDRKLLIELEAWRGRRAARYARNRRVGYTVGIGFGRDRIRVAVADLGLGQGGPEEEPRERLEKFPVADRHVGAFNKAADMVTKLLVDAGVKESKVVGVGIALPGPMRKVNPIASKRILNDWDEVEPESEMKARLGLPVVVDNDANVGALGELTAGSARGSQQVIYIHVTIGIGCGLIINGDVFRGADGTAGELHMIIDPNSRSKPCPICGNKGCVDSLLGSHAIARRLSARLPTGRDAPHDSLTFVIDRAIEDNDRQCRDLIGDMGGQLGTLLASLCTLLNPERVIIGGRVARAGDLILAPIREAIDKHAFGLPPGPGLPSAPEVTLGALGEQSVVRGALALVLRPGNGETYMRLHTLLTHYDWRKDEKDEPS